jgi:uncharacterized C2H2 Zn-finger protein
MRNHQQDFKLSKTQRKLVVETQDGEEVLAKQIHPGKIFRPGKKQSREINEAKYLFVQLEREHEWFTFEQQNGMNRVRGHGVKAVVSTSDHGWYREHAAVTHPVDLVFEIARDHIANFSDCIPYFLGGSIRINAQHARGHASRRLGAAAQAHDPA